MAIPGFRNHHQNLEKNTREACMGINNLNNATTINTVTITSVFTININADKIPLIVFMSFYRLPSQLINV